MRGAERGFLLLASQLGEPDRHPLSTAQLRILSDRVRSCPCREADQELALEHLSQMGYGTEMAKRILSLLSDAPMLDRYLSGGEKAGCFPITRVSCAYPETLKTKLGAQSPACLWYKGDCRMLELPKIALVGSRDINKVNRNFAWEAGRQAAIQGYALISGNARGADKLAQTACIQNGGKVICIVADSLVDKQPHPNILYLSEDDFDLGFSAKRAISRNRVIHSLGERTLVAQSGYRVGGTWDGTVKNLINCWSPVFCMDDGSEGALQLQQLGAVLIGTEELSRLDLLQPYSVSFFD